jgi:hypothetical protein
MITRTFILLLLLITFGTSFGQGQFGSIHVKVIDGETDRPIPYANVYISQTTIGGRTNDQGEIDVTKIPFGTHQLVISEVGHTPQQRKLVIKGTQTIYMTAKLFQRVLDVVTVTAKHDRKWRHQLKRFEKMFFGKDHFRQCNIVNPSVLQFKIEDGRFIAEAKEPLKIENDFLGYDLSFTMKDCFFDANKFTIMGYIAYEERQGSEKQLSKWNENREKIYRGSPQHFLHTVLDSTLQKEGYKVYLDITNNEKIYRGSTLGANLGKTIVDDTLTRRVSPGAYGMYVFNLPKRLEVHYLRRRAWTVAYTDVGHAVSWFEVKNETPIIVSRSGVIQNPEDVTVGGAMSNLRVADWLPLNYKYSQDYIAEPIVPRKPRLALLEKPYVQTDRDYYYNGETMWLKGYMSYAVPIMKDTLSQSVYVELSDSSGSIVATKHYHVEEGKFRGDIVFDKKWKPGPYQLKAYTAWMLNFDRRMIFTKTVDLLGEFEAVKVAADYKVSADTLPNIWIYTDKQQYSARDKITLKIDVTDSSGFSTLSDLSVSVTDLEQAVPHKNEKSILTNYFYDETPLDHADKKMQFDIEYGINFNGTFVLGRKPMQGSLTLFQDSLKGTFGIITDTTGAFKRSLMFNDTLDFYVLATTQMNFRGTPVTRKGRIIMDTSRLPCPRLDLEPLSLDIYTASMNSNVRRLNLRGANVLPEFSLTAKKIPARKPPLRMVGSGDYTVTGEWINERGFPDVLAAVAARVPGTIYDPSGPSIKFISGMFNGLRGGGSPLIVIDGVPISDQLQVVLIPMRSIEYVDVLKFALASKYGSRGAAGVVEIHTKTWKKRDPNDRSFDKSQLQLVKWIGYTTPSTFTSPDYGKPIDNGYYDYRATIYWSPTVTTNDNEPATVSFYAADAATRYRIVVEGVTAAGVPVRAEKIVDIVNGR